MYVCVCTHAGIFLAAKHTPHTCGSYFSLMLDVHRGVPACWRGRVRVNVCKRFVNICDFRVSYPTSTLGRISACGPNQHRQTSESTKWRCVGISSLKLGLLSWPSGPAKQIHVFLLGLSLVHWSAGYCEILASSVPQVGGWRVCYYLGHFPASGWQKLSSCRLVLILLRG